VVDRRAGEAVLKGAELYVPGVLAVSGGVLEGDAVKIFAAVEARPGEGRNARGPGATLLRGTTLPSPADFQRDAAGEEDRDGAAVAAESVAAAIARRAEREGGGEWVAVPVGAGRAQMTRSQIFAGDRGLAVRVERRAGGARAPPGMDALLPTVRGQAMQQNLPSIVAALALAPPPGARVLDMCAAPGGKTTLLAWMVAGGMVMQQEQREQQQEQQQHQQQPGGGGGSGVVIALDRTHAKADEVHSLARDLGVGHIVDARKMDATQCCLPDGAAEAAVAAGEEEERRDSNNNYNDDNEQEQPATKKRSRSARQEQGGSSSSSNRNKMICVRAPPLIPSTPRRSHARAAGSASCARAAS